MSHSVQFTLESKNAKVGKMPVSTTAADSCPPSCPLRDSGCYAQQGPLGGMWRALSATVAGDTFKNGRGTVQTFTWDAFTDKVAALPEGTLWRHNQAGDLPGIGDAIAWRELSQLVEANEGKRGFTYTHKPIAGEYGKANATAIAIANERGFTINLSANNLAEADTLADAAIAPVAVVLPADVHGRADISTPAGRKVAVCPATYLDDVSCASCGLCQRQERKVIVGFPAHGAAKRKASLIASK
jgi:hypothetical protein